MILTSWNIGSFMNSFLTYIYDLFRFCINTLNSIYIGNFTLLEFNITLLVLGSLLSIALTTIQNNSYDVHHLKRKNKDKSNGGE